MAQKLPFIIHLNPFEKYKNLSAAIFTRIIGVNFLVFSILLDKIEVENQKYFSERVKSSMSLSEQLFLSLLYFRNYETLLKVGSDFGISESYAQKRYAFITMLLLRCLDLPDEQAFKEAISGNQVAIDVTEQPIERPSEKSRRLL